MLARRSPSAGLSWDQGIKVGSRASKAGPRAGRRAQAIGPDVTLAIDGSSKWDLPTCLRFCRAAEHLDVYWFEEPLWYDDVRGHARLARDADPDRSASSSRRRRRILRPAGVHWVQPDVTRMARHLDVLQVCDARSLSACRSRRTRAT